MTDQSVKRKKQIMNKAKKLFAKKGYHGVRVRDVAESCGVAKGTVYLYFDSKADLFISVFVDILDSLITDLREIMNKGEKLESTLYEIFDYYGHSIRKNEFFKRFGELQEGNCGDIPMEVTREIHVKIFDRIEGMHERAVEFLSEYVDWKREEIEDLARILIGISFSIARSDSDTIKDTALKVLMNGIK